MFNVATKDAAMVCVVYLESVRYLSIHFLPCKAVSLYLPPLYYHPAVAVRGLKARPNKAVASPRSVCRKTCVCRSVIFPGFQWIAVSQPALIMLVAPTTFEAATLFASLDRSEEHTSD